MSNPAPTLPATDPPLADGGRPLRVCLFSYQFLPRVGGLEQVASSLASGWAAAGHAVTLVTTTPAPAGVDATAYDRQFGFPVVRLATGTQGRRAWGALLAGADLIVSNGMSMTYWLAWARRRVPVVFIHHQYLGIPPWGRPDPLPTQLRRWGRLAVRRWVLRRAAGNVYISRFIREQVGVRGGVVIYNPIDPAFRPMDVPRAGDIAFFGRMVEEKGVTHLLEAIALCNGRGHPFTADLYGEGPDLPRFRETAERLGLGAGQVRWHGFARGEPLVAAMNAAAVVVVPSTWYEPMGIVAVEAMACGRCVIGSAGGGLGEVLSGTCPTYPNGDSAALADRLTAVLTDPVGRPDREAAAVARSRDFTLGAVAQQYVDYFRTVLG